MPDLQRFVRGVYRGGLWGLSTPPLDLWTLLISGSFKAPTGAEPPWTNSWIIPWIPYNSFLEFASQFLEINRNIKWKIIFTLTKIRVPSWIEHATRSRVTWLINWFFIIITCISPPSLGKICILLKFYNKNDCSGFMRSMKLYKKKSRNYW